MYRRILFAIDDDEAMWAAVRVVAAHARGGLAEVHVLHVDRSPLDAAGGRRLADAVVDSLRGQGVSAAGEVRAAAHGHDVAAAIADVATSTGADLVVVGSHGRSDLGAMFLGSVSHRVAAGLDAAVLVVRAGLTTSPVPRLALVAVDGSDADDGALVEAVQLGARVLVVHVQHLMAAQPAAMSPGIAIVEPDEEADEIVDRAVRELRARGIDAEGEKVVSPSVAAAIATEAERFGADVVVLGSRRPSDMGGLLLGSVAHQVIHLLRRPVLLARRAAAAEAVR
jgi:nucleotide-binding universal stress UspA family protein